MSSSSRLVATNDAPVPAGGKAEWVLRPDGARLRAARFTPPGDARGSVVLSGGRTEPIEKYFEVIGELCARGFAVLAHDWRGQGLSDRAAAGFEVLAGDLAALIATYHAELPPPRIAVGHSMGACLTLLALADGEDRWFDGAVLSAPMLGLELGVVPLPVARLLARTYCRLGRGARAARRPVDERFEGNPLTSDRARYDRHRAQLLACPELALGEPTWAWLDAAFRAMAQLRPERLRRISIPVTVCCAQRDLVVDRAAQRRAVHHLPRGRLVEVPGSLHEILMEQDDRRAYFWWAFDEVAARPRATGA
jgi:lysophospholipase